MDKFDKLKKIKNSDISEFNLKDTKTIGKLVGINENSYIIIFVLGSVIVKFNCKLFGIDVNDEKKNYSRNRLLQLCTDQTIDLEKIYTNNELINILDNNELLINIFCDNFNLEGKLLVKLFNIDNNQLSFNEILKNEDLAKTIENKFINFN
jgi:hypothetical protein